MTTPIYPAPREHLFDPPQMLREFRGLPISKVTLWNGREVWLITRYEEARAILQDPRISSDIQNPRFPLAHQRQSFGRSYVNSSIGFMDNPRHAMVRRLVAGDDFLAGRVEELRPVIENIVSTQLERLLEATPPVDLYAAFALPIPARMIVEILGIHGVDRELFVEYAETLLSADTTSEHFTETLEAFLTLCGRVLTEEDTPSTGPIARLKAELSAGRISREEACMGTLNLITGGHATTASAISLGALMMMLSPDWFHAMRTEPEIVAPNAIEELLRYHAIINHGLPRVATDDFYVGDHLIAAGDGLIVSLAAVNRDESVFSDPDTFDIGRDNARRHIAFGHGVHTCIGQWLARSETQIALTTLAARIPTLRLAVPKEEIEFIDDSQLFRVRELPVTW